MVSEFDFVFCVKNLNRLSVRFASDEKVPCVIQSIGNVKFPNSAIPQASQQNSNNRGDKSQNVQNPVYGNVDANIRARQSIARRAKPITARVLQVHDIG